jgi:hypothetical protein
VSTKAETESRDAELEALRARVAELERELGEQSRRTASIVAESQQKLYWLDRWGVDLDRAMRVPGALFLLGAARRVRAVLWAVKRLRRRMRER